MFLYTSESANFLTGNILFKCSKSLNVQLECKSSVQYLHFSYTPKQERSKGGLFTAKASSHHFLLCAVCTYPTLFEIYVYTICAPCVCVCVCACVCVCVCVCVCTCDVAYN